MSKKLTSDEVIKLRDLYVTTDIQIAELAVRFGVSGSAIRTALCANQRQKSTWTDILRPGEEEKLKAAYHRKAEHGHYGCSGKARITGLPKPEPHIEELYNCKEVDIPIILIGNRGSGKTTIGRLLSDRLNLKFFDSDELVIKRFNKPINQIFDEFGEKEFRRVEREEIIEVLSQRSIRLNGNFILSTGGGSLDDKITFDAMRSPLYFKIYLSADDDLIAARTVNSGRPNVDTTNRSQRYESIANLTIDSNCEKLVLLNKIISAIR